MSVDTILGSATVVPFTPDSGPVPTEAAGVALDDQTILIAWETSAGITVRRYSRDLTTIHGEATTTPDADPAGLALLVGSDGVPVLLSATRSWTVNPDPVALTPGPGHTRVEWFANSGQAQVGDAVVTLANFAVTIHRPGAPLQVIPTAADVTTAHPGPSPGTCYVTTVDWDGAHVHALNLTSGAWSHALTTAPDIGWDAQYSSAVSDPGWTFAFMGFDGRLIATDAAAVTVSDPAWPGRGTPYLSGPMGTAPHPHGGTLAAAFYRTSQDYTDPTAHGMGLVHLTGNDLTVLDLPVPAVSAVQGTTNAYGPTLTARAGTVVVVQIAYRSRQHIGGDYNEFAVLAWTVDVGGHEGILDVYTLDEEWWTVGTRDPGMAHELHIYTPTGWVVEVVAGEESLATDELVVYDPHDPRAGADGWVVCALMRPV